MKIWVEASSQLWGSNGALFESRKDAEDCADQLSKEWGVSAMPLLDVLTEIDLETAEIDELRLIISKLKIFYCSPALEAAIVTRIHRLKSELDDLWASMDSRPEEFTL